MKQEKQEKPQETTATKNKAKEKTPLLDLSKSKPLEAKTVTRGSLSFRVVNTANNGKRVTLSKKLLEILGNPKAVQFRIMGDKMIIGCNLDENDNTFAFSKRATGTIYSSTIVNAVTEAFELNFTKLTSVTLNNIRVKKATASNGKTVKVVVVRRNRDGY